MDGSDSFPSLPTFDARHFEPPSWASSSRFNQNKPAEVSSEQQEDGEGSEADEEDIWADANEDVTLVDNEDPTFTTPELRVRPLTPCASLADASQKLLARANERKAMGNKHFTSKPPNMESAIESYNSALDCLPDVPKPAAIRPDKGKEKAKTQPGSGIEEVTEEEAAEIEAQSAEIGDEKIDQEKVDRDEVEEEIRDCTKACWGNLGACHLGLVCRSRTSSSTLTSCVVLLERQQGCCQCLQKG
jgi:hypothetical protein